MVLLSGCRMKLRRIALKHRTQQWADGEHGAYACLLLPVPPKDIFKLHETLRRAASSALIQMQTGKIDLSGYLNTIPRWREEQLEANPLQDPPRCSCDIGNLDTQLVLLTCLCFTNLRLRVLDPPHARTGMTWKDWLSSQSGHIHSDFPGVSVNLYGFDTDVLYLPVSAYTVNVGRWRYGGDCKRETSAGNQFVVASCYVCSCPRLPYRGLPANRPCG
jgi:hypothetical protein